MTSFAIAYGDIQNAAATIAPHVVRTPLLYSETLSRQWDLQLYFKAENLQAIGAFKARGAVNAVLSLSDEEAARGVVTHSSGNHAAALARAAQLRGITAHVVMPENSATNKIAAVRSYGVEPLFCPPSADARVAMADQLRRDTGATMVHPFDNPKVMAGQGTVGLEMLEQQPGLDACFVPVGGGGLLSGILTAVAAARPQMRVVAAEPAFADDAFRSLQSGKIEPAVRFDSIADGLRTPLGQLTFPIIRELVHEVVLAEEHAISCAVRELATNLRLVVEPSGAVAWAAFKRVAQQYRGQRVAIVISGGNLDLGRFSLAEP